jgi:signal transduction histidine kinase
VLVRDELDREPAVEAADVIYNVTREALMNARKHSGARSIDVQLRAEGDAISVRVRDDGSGFEPGRLRTRPGHIGLASMRERVELAGGRFEVQSARGAGTTVYAVIPA